jgi:hypothetical protein
MEKEGRELGEQHWDDTQQQIARAMQARWTGAVNKGLNDKRLKEIIPATGGGNNHTSDTNDLLVKLTIIRWKHARERIDIHEAYYWMHKQEETMWAKDEICFQHLVLNEMNTQLKHRQLDMHSRNDRNRNRNRNSTHNRSLDAAKRGNEKRTTPPLPHRQT